MQREWEREVYMQRYIHMCVYIYIYPLIMFIHLHIYPTFYTGDMIYIYIHIPLRTEGRGIKMHFIKRHNALNVCK